jgi:hypothetical protein
MQQFFILIVIIGKVSPNFDIKLRLKNIVWFKDSGGRF